MATVTNLIDSALSLHALGDLKAAEADCRRALAVDASHCGALAVLGMLLQATARHHEAEAVFADLTRRESQEPSHWINLGTARRALRRYDDALAAYQNAAVVGAASADFLYNVGITHLDRLDYQSARAVLARARALAPNDAEICIHFARTCELLLQNDDAVAALADWRALQHLTGDLKAVVAQLLFNLGQSAQGDLALDDALGSSDLTPGGMLVLVGTLERLNRVEEATVVMKRVELHTLLPSIEIDACIGRAQLARRSGDHEAACSLYARALQTCPELHLRHFELFPLAQSLDKLGRYEDAYATLLEAHASQLAHLHLAAPLDAARGPPPMVVTEFGCELGDVRHWDEAGAPSTLESPIFIVGFPRSGTTLLELTLDAHPLVRGMDEQPFIQNALDEILGAGADYPHRLAGLSTGQLNAIRDRYWTRADRKAHLRPGDRLLDKNPLNILRLPVIRRLFPHARIVLAVRHPCDVLLSCFMQHFRAADFALLCQSLASVAQGYRRTLDFWYGQAALLKPAVRELHYETFVNQFESEVRSLCAFLQLPWDAAMLAPSEHARRKGYISTPSYSQVVNPVSDASVGRWKHYERHFRAVLPVLDPYLRRWGYQPAFAGESGG